MSCRGALETGVWGSDIKGSPLRIGLLGGFIRDRDDGELMFLSSDDWPDLITGEGCRWRDRGSPFSPSVDAQRDSRAPESPGISS